jgi:hypothetical protein
MKILPTISVSMLILIAFKNKIYFLTHHSNIGMLMPVSCACVKMLFWMKGIFARISY